jgi:predicted dehydrogenase
MICVGVVGCGHWGPNLIRNFSTLLDSELVGICDADPKRLDAVRPFYTGVPCFRSFDEMLEQPGLDAVCIATPVATHYPFALKALEAGKHVLLEKPMAQTSGQCERLIAAAEKSDRVLCVGHVFLFNKAVRYVKQQLDEGELGEVHYFYFTRTNLGPVREDTNAMWDLATHDISIAMHWMGELPAKVRASGHTYLAHKCEDVVFSELVFANGVVAHLHVSWLDPCKVRRATLIGSKRMLVYTDTDPIAPVTIYDKRVDQPDFTDTQAAFHMSIREGDIRIPRLTIGEPLKAECQHFLDCINKKEKPLTDGQNGLDVVRVLERLQESMESNGTLLDL